MSDPRKFAPLPIAKQHLVKEGTRILYRVGQYSYPATVTKIDFTNDAQCFTVCTTKGDLVKLPRNAGQYFWIELSDSITASSAQIKRCVEYSYVLYWYPSMLKQGQLKTYQEISNEIEQSIAKQKEAEAYKAHAFKITKKPVKWLALGSDGYVGTANTEGGLKAAIALKLATDPCVKIEVFSQIAKAEIENGSLVFTNVKRES